MIQVERTASGITGYSVAQLRTKIDDLIAQIGDLELRQGEELKDVLNGMSEETRPTCQVHELIDGFRREGQILRGRLQQILEVYTRETGVQPH